MKHLIALVTLALAGGLHVAPAAAQQTIECRSNNNDRRECRVPWSRSELVRQTGNRVCIPGTTWGESNGRVWVSQGCSGVFAEARGWGPGGGGGAGEQITCRSERNRRQECRTNNWRDARLVRQISSTRCEQGRNWDIRRGILWVDLGCAGVFAEARGGSGGSGGSGGGWGGGAGGRIECNSQNNRYRECPVGNNWRGARLVRQTSNAQCVEGRTWGYGRGMLWVDRGCAGIFEASRSGSAGSVRTISCNSRNNRRQDCPAGSWRSAVLVRQTSRASCIEGRTWGFGRGMIWVDQGCAGDFAERRR